MGAEDIPADVLAVVNASLNPGKPPAGLLTAVVRVDATVGAAVVVPN